MNFLNDIKNSLYNTAFYASLRERKLSSSFKYFFSVVAILAFIIAFVLGTEIAPFFSGENLRKFVAYYPQELTVDIKGGVISTNVTEPYIIKTSGELLGKNPKANIVVIDTKNQFSRELFKQYDTSVWVGRDFIVAAKNQDQSELNDVSRMPDFTLNQGKLLDWVNIIDSYHWTLSIGLFVVLFLFLYGFFVLKLVWLAIMALLILLLAKVKKVALSYKESYKIALHAATVPLVLVSLFMLSDIKAPFIFFFSLILLVIAYANLSKPPVS